MAISDDKAAYAGKTIKLTYPAHFLEDGRTICGEHLAAELVADALKLLLAIEADDADAAWKKLWDLAAPVARQLEADVKAGKHPGLVLQFKKNTE